MELVQIVDEQNRESGTAPRNVMRSQRLLHRCTYIFVFNSQGELFVQQRTLTKDIYPGFLDLAAGGVIVAGESYDLGAQRELAEELGICGVPLTHHGVIYYEDKLSRVFGAIYSCVWDGPMQFQVEEVAGGNFYSIDQVCRMADEGAQITPDSLAALSYLQNATEPDQQQWLIAPRSFP